ncbi:MAG: AAA family ATPase, partial [Bryobacterales bacterium]|nr:AAA family ATPase [Bryobacterales bacterium]
TYSMVNELKTRFFRLKSEIRELQLKINREDETRGSIEEINRKIEVFEQGNYHEIFVDYRRLKRQESIIHDTRCEIMSAIEKISELAENLEPSDIRREDFDKENTAESSVLDWIERAVFAQSKSAKELRNLAENLKNFTHKWQSRLSKKYCQKRDGIFLEYDQMGQNFLRNGIKNSQEYSSLIQRRQALMAKLRSFEKCKLKIQELERESSVTIAKIEALRIELSKKREKFLNTVLQENRYVRISVIPFGDSPEMQEAEFRQALGRKGNQLERDILTQDRSTGILAKLYQDLPDKLSDERTNELARRVRQVKADILALRSDMSENTQTRWFVNHIQGLSAAQIDGIELWMPRDSLRIEYCRPDGSSWSPIEDGSPGQKSAALLAFLLSYGKEPIILDQPEDDLDNHLIYDLIVQQIRESKKSRQVIVVTHNPNIVVNGDAEAVISMNYRHGQCMIEENGTGCLQEPGPRKEICRVMEGGLKAFKSRYKRLAAGEIDVC